MRTEQGNMLLSLHQVQAFLDHHADKFAGVMQTGVRQRLADAITALEGHATEQSGKTLAIQAASRTQHELRTTLLRDHMAPIARIAKVDLPRTAELAPLRMPRGSPAVMRLATAARGMADAAAAHTETFVAAALPADFVAQLNQAADALVAAVKGGTESRGLVKEATTGLRAKLTAGRKIVHVLDALVKKTLKKEHPELLANWNVVKRVRRTGVHSAPATPAPAPTGSSGTPPTPPAHTPDIPAAPAPTAAAA